MVTIFQSTLDYQRVLAISNILVAVLISVLALLSTQRGVVTYELSFYSRLPVIFWIGLMIVFLTIFLNCSYSVYTESPNLVAFFLYILSLIVLLTLPVVLGDYNYGRTDSLTHLGRVRDLHFGGAIGETNLYPLIHLLIHITAEITGLNINTIFKITPALFSVFFVLSAYLASVLFVFSKAKSILIAIIVSAPIYQISNITVRPFEQFIFFIPFAIFLFLSCELSNKHKYFYLLILLAIFMSVSHPLVALYMGFIALSYWISRIILRRRASVATAPTIVYYVLLQFVTVYLVVESVSGGFKTEGVFSGAFVRFILSRGGSTGFESQSQVLSIINVQFVDLIQAVLFRLGPYLILYFVASILIGYTIFIFVTHRGNQEYLGNPIILLYALVPLTSIFIIFSFFFDVVAGFQRFIRLGLPIVCLVIGHRFVIRLNSTNIDAITTGIAFVLIAVLLLSTFTVYNSPETNFKSSQQVTDSEIEGMGWILEYRPSSSEVSTVILDLHRYNHAINGRDHIPNDRRIRSTQTLTSDYLVISEPGKKLYQGLYVDYPNYAPYDHSEFRAIEKGESMSCVYDNGGFSIHR